MERIGVDIDLRRCHAWSDEQGRLLYNGTHQELRTLLIANPDATCPVECSSPIIYGIDTKDGKSMLRNKLRWMIYNMYTVGFIGDLPNLLFSPSSTWKHGWQENEMMEILDISGDNHDIRQCRAMVIMQTMHPQDWVGIDEFLEKL